MITQARSTDGLNRRTFMKRMAGLGGTLMATGYVPMTMGSSVARARSGIREDRIGVQLYTVRDQLQQDFEGTIGHQYITVPAITEAFAGTMTPDAWPRYAEELNQIGVDVLCNARGVRRGRACRTG